MILSYKMTTINGRTHRTVLTCGDYAAKTGRMDNDLAVYYGAAGDVSEHIARHGNKLSYGEAVSAGYKIAETDYRK